MLKPNNALFIACSVTSVSAATPQQIVTPPSSNLPITPIVRPTAERMGGYFSVDVLYWTARQESLEYAYDGMSDNSVETAGKVWYPEWKWDPGFKMGLGYYTAYDGWDVFAEYTRLKSSMAGNAFPSGDTNLKKNWQMTASPTSLAQASCNWDLNFNVIDLSLGRNFFISRDLALHPYVGVKSVWYDQNYIVNYEGASGPSSIMNQHQDAAGLGLRTGVDAFFNCTKHFSIFGRMAASVLWEKFKVHREDYSYIPTSEGDEIEKVTFLINKDLSIAEPFIEAALGFELQHYFLKDRLRLAFRGSYEFQIFFDQSQYIRAILDSGGNGGNLTLQGMTAKVQLDF